MVPRISSEKRLYDLELMQDQILFAFSLLSQIRTRLGVIDALEMTATS